MAHDTTPSDTPKRLINERETCRYLGVSRSFLAKSRCDGTRANHSEAPPWIHFGRRIAYAVDDLDRWIAEHRRSPISPAHELKKSGA